MRSYLRPAILFTKPGTCRPGRYEARRAAGAGSADSHELRASETEIKYAGYFSQQRRSIERLEASEPAPSPLLQYKGLVGLSRELQEKLTRIRPSTRGQASRILGVTPRP